MWLVSEFLVAAYTRSGRRYHVIFERVDSLSGGCEKSSPRVAGQPSVIETCKCGHICIVTWTIDNDISRTSGYSREWTRLAGVGERAPTWGPSEWNENICHTAHSVHTLSCIIGQKFLPLASLIHHLGAPLANCLYQFWKYASSCVRWKCLRILVVQLVDNGVMIVFFPFSSLSRTRGPKIFAHLALLWMHYWFKSHK